MACRFDPGPDSEFVEASCKSFDPGPDPQDWSLNRSCRFFEATFDGDPGPDVFAAASFDSEKSEVTRLQAKRRKITLTTASADVGQGEDKPCKLSKYAQNGISADRIIEVLKGDVKCCTADCIRRFSVKQVSDVCEKYWCLSDGRQRFLLRYLWGLNGEDVDGDDLENTCTSRSMWSFGGQDICLTAFCKLLGSSKRTILARAHGSVDLRKTRRLRDQPKSRMIDRFWLEYWSSNAETLALPDKSRPTKEKGDDVLVYDEGVLVEIEEYTFSCVEDWTLGISDVELFSRLGNKEALLKLPRRFLPHGRLADYFLEYCSWHESSTKTCIVPEAIVLLKLQDITHIVCCPDS